MELTVLSEYFFHSGNALPEMVNYERPELV